MSGPTGMSTAPRYSASDSAKLPIVVILYLIFVITPVEFKLGTVSLTPLRMLLLILVIPLTGRLFSGQFGKAMAVDYLFFIHMAWATLQWRSTIQIGWSRMSAPQPSNFWAVI